MAELTRKRRQFISQAEPSPTAEGLSEGGGGRWVSSYTCSFRGTQERRDEPTLPLAERRGEVTPLGEACSVASCSTSGQNNGGGTAASGCQDAAAPTDVPGRRSI